VWRYQLFASHRIRKPPSSASYQTPQAVVERGFDENLQQGARCIKQPYKPPVSRVFAENFAAKLLQPPQRDQARGFTPSI
jgi:hypothetical protein